MSYLIFPHQLYEQCSKRIKPGEAIYLIEEPRYFTDFGFHKIKLAYHRATMRKYFDFLKKKYPNQKVKYVEVGDLVKVTKSNTKSPGRSSSAPGSPRGRSSSASSSKSERARSASPKQKMGWKDTTNNDGSSFYKSLKKPVRYIRPVDYKLESKLEKFLGKARKEWEEAGGNWGNDSSSSSSSSASAGQKRGRSPSPGSTPARGSSSSPAMKRRAVDDDKGGKSVGSPNKSPSKSKGDANHVMLENLTFLVTFKEVQTDVKNKMCNRKQGNKLHYSHDAFYQYQRKKLDIMIAKGGGWEGGKLSFDADNREPLPKGIKVGKVTLLIKVLLSLPKFN
jgi:hypothetical protein